MGHPRGRRRIDRRQLGPARHRAVRAQGQQVSKLVSEVSITSYAASTLLLTLKLIYSNYVCARARAMPPVACSECSGVCRKQCGSGFCQLGLRRLLSSPDHASGCPKLRPQASANQPLGQRWPVIYRPILRRFRRRQLAAAATVSEAAALAGESPWRHPPMSGGTYKLEGVGS